MNVISITNEEYLSVSQIGGKAFNLQRLISGGLNVPETYVIPVSEIRNIEFNEIEPPVIYFPKYLDITKKYAVRSSGVGEDGNENSFAGVFDSFLNVKYQNIPKEVHKVFDSKNSPVSKMYNDAKHTLVTDMAVIIQEMIDADYAGVAFSVNPIEKDKRIGLIEIVKGVGESLVAGKVKPTSVRINKITGISRVIQSGAEGIPKDCFDEMITAISAALQETENLFKSPVDIEWAYKNKELYLLQARPITALGDVG